MLVHGLVHLCLCAGLCKTAFGGVWYALHVLLIKEQDIGAEGDAREERGSETGRGNSYPNFLTSRKFRLEA